MPKVLTEQPEALRPYLFHGVDLSWDRTNATGDCPWCGADGKFSISVETGVWRCWVCGEGNDRGGGNVYTFLRKLWEVSDRATTDYHDLAKDRGLMPDTLVHWELAKSILTGDWLVPGYSIDGRLCQLYRYVRTAKRKLLMPTPPKEKLGHQLFGVNLYRADCKIIYLCEGPWDGMKLWEALGSHKESDQGLIATANVDRSLLRDASVLATPGAWGIKEQWLPLFKDKIVYLCFDNDHPKVNEQTGKLSQPAGYAGMERVAKMLAGTAKEIYRINWKTRH